MCMTTIGVKIAGGSRLVGPHRRPAGAAALLGCVVLSAACGSSSGPGVTVHSDGGSSSDGSGSIGDGGGATDAPPEATGVSDSSASGDGFGSSGDGGACGSAL